MTSTTPTPEEFMLLATGEPDEDIDHELERDVVLRMADLEAKHDAVLQLIEQIGGIVKKSTSKVSLEVKAAIDAWANPTVPDAVQIEGTVEGGGSTDGEAVSGIEYAPDAQPIPPQHDAPVDEWREYACALGVDDQTRAVFNTMNRSQIRTMLGIEQLASAVES